MIHPISFSSLLILACCTTFLSIVINLIFSTSSVSAWSPSDPPILLNQAAPQGLRFGDAPTTTQCCFSTTEFLYCATDGTDRDRVRLQKFRKAPMELLEEVTIDAMNTYNLRKCAFAVGKTTTLAGIGYKTNVNGALVVLQLNPQNMVIDAWSSFPQNCNIDSPTKGALFLDSYVILASAGQQGIARIQTLTNPKTCQLIDLKTNDMPSTQPSTVYGAFSKSSNDNITYWITNDALFRYNAQLNKIESNITTVNSTQHSLATEGPVNTVYIWTKRTAVNPPAPPTTELMIHKIDINPLTPNVLTQQIVTQEVVGFMRVAPPLNKIFTAIRSPYLGLAVFDTTNLALAPTTYDATADSTEDPGAVLPAGNVFFQAGDAPSVFSIFDTTTRDLYLFATPKTNTGGASTLLLPTLAISFNGTTLKRTSHFVNRAGATTVASSAVGGGSFFIVLSSTPSTVVMLNAEDLSVVQDQFQPDMLNSTDVGTQLLDSICVFDESNSYFYVTGTYASTNGEPAWIARFNTAANTLSYQQTVILGSGKRQGVLVLADDGDTLYVSGATGTTNSIYIQKVNVKGATMSLDASEVVTGKGSKVLSAVIDATGGFLLVATDTQALIAVRIISGVITLPAITIRSQPGAQTLAADRYGFLTVGYSNPGAIDVVHVRSQTSYIEKQALQGSSSNINVLRATDDDNMMILGYSSTLIPNQPPQSSIFSVTLDLVNSVSYPPTLGSPTTLSLSSPSAIASLSGFTFALGRQQNGNNVVAIFRTGSRTAYEQHRELTSNAKRSRIIMPNTNFSMMTRDEAAALCTNLGLGGLVEFFDPTELDAMRGLFDQDPVWVAGTFDSISNSWIWPSGAPPASWWAKGFPYVPASNPTAIDKCVYVRQGKLFNGNCALKMLPACSSRFSAVSRSLVYQSIPETPWIILGSKPRTGTIGGVFGLRRVDFVSNYFECTSQPWAIDIDYDCGAAWDSNVFGVPKDVQLVSYNKMFVATSTSLYEVDLRLASQSLIRQYNSFRRNMQVIQKWNMTIVYGESRTDFIVSYGNGLRQNVWTLTGTEACDNVQFIESNWIVLCLTRQTIAYYSYTLDLKTFRVVLSNRQIGAGPTSLAQQVPIKFTVTSPTYSGVFKMSIFGDLVTQDVAYNASADPRDVCELIERTCPPVTSTPTLTQASFTTYTSATVMSAAAGKSCSSGRYDNCIRTQIPLTRPGMMLDCSAAVGCTPSSNGFPAPSKTLGWVDQVLAKVTERNGQVSLDLGSGVSLPSDLPASTFQVTSAALEDGLVTIAFTVENFPCFSRASDLSSYCMSTLVYPCDPAKYKCYETHAFGGVGFADACDVLRTCTATVTTAFNVNEYNPSQPSLLTEKMIMNAQTFAGKLETLLQFNVTGQPTSRVTTLDNRLAVFQSFGNASRVDLDRSTSWLTRDSPPRAFSLMHPTVATRSISATAASLMTDAETLFWKRSKELILDPSGTSVFYAIGVFTDDIDELDNVVQCQASVTGILRFAPFIQNKEVTMPPIVVDSKAPGELDSQIRVQYAVFENSTGLLSNSSFVNISTGEFSLHVNCNVTMALQLFLTFANGATASIPFYIIGKSVTGVAGAPPTVATYPPVPSPIRNWTSTTFAAPLDGLNGANDTTAVQNALTSAPLASGATAPAVNLYVNPEIGSFVISDACAASIARPSFSNTNPNAEFKTNNVSLNLATRYTFKQAIDTCISFFPSPAFNYTQKLSPNPSLQVLKIEINALNLGTTEVGFIAMPLSAIPLRNTGPQIALDPCNVTITVGHQTIASFGQVFKHPVGVHMSITPKIIYRADSGNQAIDITCNATGFCWTFFESIATTTNFELTASDGYFYASTSCGVYGEFVNLRVDTIPSTYVVHAGSSFTYTIPTNLFLSSSSWTVSSVTEGSFALETGISFQSPLLIVGAFKYAKLYNLTITATNVFGSATGYILFLSTNAGPVSAAAYTYNKRALVAFDEELTLNTLVTDDDSDALKFTILDSGLLPSWLATSIAPGTMTTSPQVLTLKGTATADYAGSTTQIKVQVEDAWNTTVIFIDLVMRVEYLTANPQTNVSLYTTEIHPGSSFSIPVNLSSLFNSSTVWDFYFSHRISSDLPINSLSFTQPLASGSNIGFITGLLDGPDALSTRNITLTAISPFSQADAFLIIKPVNKAPTVTSLANSSALLPINLGTFHASHAMKLDVQVSNYFSDGDNDPLNFFVTTDVSNSWIASFVVFSPDGYSTNPKTMTIDGTIPASAVNRNVTLDLHCTDKWNTTTIPFLIVIPQARKPVQLKNLPNFTVVPEESISEDVRLTPEYFYSPDGDQITASVQIVKGASWITITLTGDVGAEKLTVVAAPSIVQDDDGEILITVKNPFGNTSSASIFVKAEMTDWQRIYSTAVLVISIGSAALGIFGLWAYYPMIISFFKGARVVIKCPLNLMENPAYHFPPETEEVKVWIREDKLKFLSWFSHWVWNFWTLKPQPRNGPPCYLKVYDKHVALRLDKEFDLEDPPNDCYVQFFNGDGIVLQEFDVNFREVMCVPNNMKEGIWSPKTMLFGNAGGGTAAVQGVPVRSIEDFMVELPPRANPISKRHHHHHQQQNSSTIPAVATAAPTVVDFVVPQPTTTKNLHSFREELSLGAASGDFAVEMETRNFSYQPPQTGGRHHPASHSQYDDVDDDL